MEEIPLNRDAIRRIRKAQGPVRINIETASFRNYPVKSVKVIPARAFIRQFPKNAVPVYIIGKTGKRVLPAVVKNARSTSIEVMKRLMPTVIAANPYLNIHSTFHYSEGPIIQVASFPQPKNPEILVDRYLKKAEEATAHNLMLTDPRPENTSHLEHFDPITMDIPKGTSKRRALQIQLADALGMVGMIDAPEWALRRIRTYDEAEARRRLIETKRWIERVLKKV